MKFALLLALMAAVTVPAASEPQISETNSKSIYSKVISTVLTDKKSYKIGESVNLTLVVENTSSQSIVLNFSSGQRFDFWIQAGSKEVWRWSSDKMFTQALTSMTLKPGEKKTFTANWDQKDSNGNQTLAGNYTAFGQLTTMQTRPTACSSAFAIGTPRGTAATKTNVKTVVTKIDKMMEKRVSILGLTEDENPTPIPLRANKGRL